MQKEAGRKNEQAESDAATAPLNKSFKDTIRFLLPD